MEDDFKKLIDEYSDCPDEIFKLARTPFEKAVAVEFFALHKKLDEQTSSMKKDIDWLKWLIISVFGLSILGVLSQWFPQILKLING
jgi:hypothetical protein